MDTDSARKWMEAFLLLPGQGSFCRARQLLFLSAAFLAVTALLSLLLILLFTHSITRRTGALAEKMERLLGGEAEIGPAESGADEIAQIDRHFTSLAARLQEMIRQKYVLELEKTKARLDSLQAQINPHFLYNALSTISGSRWTTAGNLFEKRGAAGALLSY